MKKIKIKLAYLRGQNDGWKTVEMTPEQYFDLSDGEPVDIDCVPQHSELLDYIPDNHTVSKISLRIKNVRKRTELRVNISLWNHQRCRLVNRQEFRKKKMIHNEFIYESSLNLPNSCNHSAIYDICRFTVEGDLMDCVYHGIITDNDDGSESEYRVI